MSNYTEIKKNHICSDPETIWLRKSKNRGMDSKYYHNLYLRVTVPELVLFKAFGKIPKRVSFAISKTNCHQFIIGQADDTGYALDNTGAKYHFRVSFRKIGGRLDYFKHIFGGESYDHVYLYDQIYLPDGAGVEFKVKELKNE